MSRMTVFKKIKNLVKYKMVVERSSGRKVLLFVDNKSLIIQEENNIKNFRKSYLNLLRKANLEYKTNLDLRGHVLESGQTHISDDVYSTIIDRYDDLTTIFQELVKGYSLKAIFEWPEEIKDRESLNRLYLKVFHMLSDIFSEHVKYSIPFDIQDEHKRIGLLRGMQDSLKNSLENPYPYRESSPKF